MLEDKLRATDWEATNEIIEEQVARESYLQWFKDNERLKRNMVNTKAALGGSVQEGLCENNDGHCSTFQTNGTSPMRASSSSTATSPPKTFECAGTSTSTHPHTSGSVSQPAQSCSTSDFHINEQATFLNDIPPDCFGEHCCMFVSERTHRVFARRAEFIRMTLEQTSCDNRTPFSIQLSLTV